MILELVRALGGWVWWIVGLLLLCVEVLAPGFFFLWFGLAAIAIGISALLVDWPWQLQIVGFAALSVAAALAGRRMLGPAAGEVDPPLGSRAERLKGETFILDEPIVEGRGRVIVGETAWQVRGPDLPAGARVKVVSGDGVVLIVDAA